MFDVSICVEENKVLSRFVIDSYFFEPAKYDYAFYLYKDGEKLNTTQYTKSMKVIFDSEGIVGVFKSKLISEISNKGIKEVFIQKKISIRLCQI